MEPSALTVLLICFLLLTSSIHGEESNKNRFRDREATDDALGYPHLDEDALLNTQCPRNLELRWQTEVSSSVYASPLIADINSDGKLDIVVPSFVHYLEVLEGSDGDKMPGWPAFHQSTVHASPLLYDIDKDGQREIALATYNGEVLFFRVSGFMMTDKLEVPRRRVKKNWYVGLDLDPVDRSHPDVDDDQLILEASEKKSESPLGNRGVDLWGWGGVVVLGVDVMSVVVPGMEPIKLRVEPILHLMEPIRWIRELIMQRMEQALGEGFLKMTIQRGHRKLA
ncbi:hypothetical protein OIU84_011137 [Salix udensis]|uniref:FG-GAP repeat-containing protein n=1 Tax=Salix udensis TaxID=889485 RepID=A0AAD6JN12_9ROSI|nr:hypothetical protein OIU84_011137 [Salix udensis]